MPYVLQIGDLGKHRAWSIGHRVSSKRLEVRTQGKEITDQRNLKLRRQKSTI